MLLIRDFVQFYKIRWSNLVIIAEAGGRRMSLLYLYWQCKIGITGSCSMPVGDAKQCNTKEEADAIWTKTGE